MGKNSGQQGSRPISRRSLLKGIGAGALAAAAPNIVIAAEKDPSMKSKVLGTGAHTYELVENWGKLPESKKFGYTHGVQEDSQGRIYIHNQSPDSVAIFDPDGKFIKSWGPQYAAGAHGFQLRKEDGVEYFYLAATSQHIVAKTTLDGEVVWTLNYPKEAGVYEAPEKFVPTNVAFGPNGDFYVADGYGQAYIHQYNKKAEYIRTWGGNGSEPGKMKCPHGIWLDTRGKEPLLVVADRANIRLQYFTLDGKHVSFVTDELRYPCHFDQRGTDLLIPDLHGRVTIFDKDNKLITHLGDTPGVEKKEGYPNLPHEQRIPGQFISPHAATWDHAGNIYVVEWVSDGRVTKLRRV
ncbi:MAG: twin-arginine translocation signal domain-containing protein [Candidatus Hydrogenedentes bacterium]|nr:twin-arginine translocation signal domain-containing protein [Candidatus Hydrogenedentota bacterium]